MALKQAARERKIDVVLVWKLDRWGRSLVDAIQGIDELRTAGVRWISVTQGFDTDESNPGARLMLQIFAAFAEFERAMIRERVIAGMGVAKRKGTHCGRKKVVVDRKRVATLHSQGLSVRAIAVKLGVHRNRVHAVLPRK